QVRQAAVVNFLRTMQEHVGVSANDILLAVTTLSFDIAVLELFLPLLVGARVVLASRVVAADGQALAATLDKVGATVMQATPATWRLLLEAGWQGSPRLQALCGGEALLGSLAERLQPRVAALWNLYGPTETTVWSAVQRVDQATSTTGAAPIGQPLANTQIYLLDQAGRPVPIGVPGELYIGGAGLTRGYLNRPDLTAERFLPDPFSPSPGARLYRTGDRARRRADGAIAFLGRLDHQVKLRGYRIELGEIEAALCRHPAVREAAVLLREDRPGDQRLVAYLVSSDGAMPSPEELRQRLAASLPPYMLPVAFVPLDNLPLTPNGKLDRKALPAPDPAARPATTFMAPRSVAEQAIAAIWREVLGVEQVGLDDNFFDLGGHSLLLIQVRDRLRDRLSLQVPVITFFRYPTVRSLASSLRVADEPVLAGRAQHRALQQRASVPVERPTRMRSAR
ncbi:MAG TPA: non-ribosomal peptide synthetase, partial [Chloroflexota bacterium]|nr:non-ribosomal peptide synthetase [Chloroflexota bacterium]